MGGLYHSCGAGGEGRGRRYADRGPFGEEGVRSQHNAWAWQGKGEMMKKQELSGDLSGGSIDAAEVEKFERMAAEWWDPHGKFKPLHQMNPVRLDYVTSRIAAHFGRDRR